MINKSQAETVDEKAQIFMNLSQEYLEIVPFFDSRMGMGDSPELRVMKRNITLATALFRKFITSGENTYIPGIMQDISKRLGVLAKKTTPPSTEIIQLKKTIAANQKLMKNELSGIYSIFDLTDGSVQKDDEVIAVDKLINGHLLHADREKFSLSGSQWLHASFSLMMVQHRMSRSLEMYRNFFAAFHEVGVLPSLKYDSEINRDHINEQGELLEKLPSRIDIDSTGICNYFDNTGDNN